MAGEECLTVEEEDGERFRIASSVSYLFIFLIGIPIWWKSTEVYRVSLPYSNIHKLSENHITLPVMATIISDDQISMDLLPELQNKDHFNLNLTRLTVDINWKSRLCNDVEISIFDRSSFLAEADDKFSLNTSSGSINIYILSRFTHLLPSDIYVGAHRNVFIKNSNDLASQIIFVMKKLINPNQLQHSYHQLVNRKINKGNDKESMKSISSSPTVDVTFTLILPESSVIHVTWDIQEAIQSYLQPFAEKYQTILDFNINSQILYLTLLDIKTQQDRTSKHFIVHASQLPHLINPIEIKLGSYVTTNPALNFVTYVAPAHQRPLQIYDSNGEMSKLNSFLIPRWGGFLVYNVNESESNPSIDMHHVFEIFLSQIRSLLGIPQSLNNDGRLTYGDINENHIREWEYDFVLRMRLLENLLTATNTLNSLAQLLEEISNIVIADHVGELIFNATHTISQSYEALYNGDIEAAFLLSKSALIASEAAFIDPSLLALLYFPEDQKYAIYVPLFAPISLPLILSFVSIVKIIMKRRRKVNEKDKSD